MEEIQCLDYEVAHKRGHVPSGSPNSKLRREKIKMATKDVIEMNQAINDPLNQSNNFKEIAI